MLRQLHSRAPIPAIERDYSRALSCAIRLYAVANRALHSSVRQPRSRTYSALILRGFLSAFANSCKQFRR